MLLLTALLGSELRHLRLEKRIADEVAHDRPDTAIDWWLEKALGLAQTSMIGMALERGDVFTPDALAHIRRTTEAVEALPGIVPGSVLSLSASRAKAITADGDWLHVEPLVPDEIPTDPEDLAALRERLLASDVRRFHRCGRRARRAGARGLRRRRLRRAGHGRSRSDRRPRARRAGRWRSGRRQASLRRRGRL